MPIAGSFQRGPAFGLRRVKGAVGKRLDILGQRGEPVSEPARDVQHRAVVFRQFGPVPFKIGRRTGTQIDDRVPERPP